MTAVIALLFFLGIYPGPLVHLIQHVVERAALAVPRT